jgi:hypothetical protein
MRAAWAPAWKMVMTGAMIARLAVNVDAAMIIEVRHFQLALAETLWFVAVRTINSIGPSPET